MSHGRNYPAWHSAGRSGNPPRANPDSPTPSQQAPVHRGPPVAAPPTPQLRQPAGTATPASSRQLFDRDVLVPRLGLAIAVHLQADVAAQVDARIRFGVIDCQHIIDPK